MIVYEVYGSKRGRVVVSGGMCGLVYEPDVENLLKNHKIMLKDDHSGCFMGVRGGK